MSHVSRMWSQMTSSTPRKTAQSGKTKSSGPSDFLRICNSSLALHLGNLGTCLLHLVLHSSTTLSVTQLFGEEQEPIIRSFHLPYWPYESTLSRIFLFLEASPTGVFEGVFKIANHERAAVLYCYKHAATRQYFNNGGKRRRKYLYPQNTARLSKADHWHQAKTFNRVERKQLRDENQYIYFQTAITKHRARHHKIKANMQHVHGKFHILSSEGKHLET